MQIHEFAGRVPVCARLSAGWFPAEQRGAVFWHRTAARQYLLERNSKLTTNARAEAENIAINSEYH